MHWTDRLERLGRLALWLSLASAVVLVPIIYGRMRAEEAQKAELARQDAERLAKEGAKEGRLTLQSMGPVMRALNTLGANGRVWFSNVSDGSGVVCVVGIVTNPTTKATTESLATCKQVSPYASNVELQVEFAGGELEPLCKGVTCSLSLRDVPDAVAAPAENVAASAVAAQ